MGNVILFNKPYNVLSQFTDKDNYKETRQTLSDFIKTKGFYAAGRLDKDSEGLLILTNDGVLQAKISNPKYKLKKIYWTQVEGEPTEESLHNIRKGIIFQDLKCLPASVRVIKEPSALWKRSPPIRYRKHVKDTWLEIILSEGKNRQIRRMTAAIGHPTLRLIRYAVGRWSIEGLAVGSYSNRVDID